MPARPPPLRGKADDAVVNAINELYRLTSQHEGAILDVRQQLKTVPTAAQISSQIKASATEQALSTLAAAQLTSGGVSTGVTGQGSILPIPASGMLYDNATANTIKWYSTSLVLYLPDGRIVPIPDTTVAQPIISVTGLTAGTTYFFYPAYNVDLGIVQFMQVNGGVGTPPAAYLMASLIPRTLAAQAANGDGKIPLSPTSSVTAAATGGGGGGGSGGGSGCIRAGMFVQTKRSILTLAHCRVGQEILGPDGWSIVKNKVPSMQPEFLRFRFGLGDWIDVTPSHPMMPYKSAIMAPAKSWCLADKIPTRSGLPAKIVSIERIEESDEAEIIECAPYHTFFVGGERPDLVMHNFQPLK